MSLAKQLIEDISSLDLVELLLSKVNNSQDAENIIRRFKAKKTTFVDKGISQLVENIVRYWFDNIYDFSEISEEATKLKFDTFNQEIIEENIYKCNKYLLEDVSFQNFIIYCQETKLIKTYHYVEIEKELENDELEYVWDNEYKLSDRLFDIHKYMNGYRENKRRSLNKVSARDILLNLYMKYLIENYPNIL